MSLVANSVAHNLFLVSVMMSYQASVTSTMLFGDLQPYYVTLKQHMKLRIITRVVIVKIQLLHKWFKFHVICHYTTGADPEKNSDRVPTINNYAQIYIYIYIW